MYTKRAQSNLEIDEYQAAVTDFDRALELGAQQLGDIYYNRGFAKFNLEQYEDAIVDFDNAIIQGFAVPVAYMNRGRAKIELGQVRDAIDVDFSTALILDSQDAQTYLERGLAYFGLDSFQLAIDDFGNAIGLNGELAEAYYNRGLGHLEIKQRDSAKEDFDDAIRLDSDFTEAYLSRGFLHFKLDEHLLAVEDLTKVVSLDPENTEAMRLRALSNFTLGNYQNSVDDLTKIIDADRQDMEAYFARGYAYENLGEFDPALQDFDRVLFLDTGDASALYTRAYVHFKAGNAEQAIQDYDRVIAIDALDPDAYHNRGLVRFQLGNFLGAFQDFDAAVFLDTGDTEGYDMRGNSSLNLAQPGLSIQDYLTQLELAIQDYDTTIRLNPLNAQAYLNRGHAHRVLGQVRAQAYAELGNRQRDSSIYVGELQKAILDYDKVILLDPTNSRAFANRGLTYLNIDSVTKGLNLEITINEINRIPAIRFSSSGDSQYSVTPSGSGQELVVLHVDVFNIGGENASLTLDGDSVELRGFGPNEIFRLLDLSVENTDNVKTTSPDASVDRHTPFLAGPIEVPPGGSKRGWVAFQVPKDIRIKEMRWDAQEVIYLKMPPLHLALEDLDEAIALDQNYFQAYNYRGLVRAALGQFSGAMQDYSQAVNLSPEYALAYTNRGDASRTLGNIPTAIVDYNQAVRVSPRYENYHVDRGLAYSTSEKVAKGKLIIIRVQQMERVPDVRYQGSDELHYVIAPASEENELLVLLMEVYKVDEPTTLLMFDADSIELRGAELNETYRFLDPTFENVNNVRTVDEADPAENRYLPFLAGSLELTGPHSSATGWIVFEVRKGAELRELRWGTGEVFYLRLDQLQGALEDFTESVQLADDDIVPRLRNGQDGLDDVIERRKLAS